MIEVLSLGLVIEHMQVEGLQGEKKNLTYQHCLSGRKSHGGLLLAAGPVGQGKCLKVIIFMK